MTVAWLPWLRRACPSATLDKKSVFSCSADYTRADDLRANDRQTSGFGFQAPGSRLVVPQPVVRSPASSGGTFAVHYQRIECRHLAEIHEVGGKRILLRQRLEVGQFLLRPCRVEPREE